MNTRLFWALVPLWLSACGGGGIDGARVGVPDVMPQAVVAADPIVGWVSDDVDRPEDGAWATLDARPSVGVRYRWDLEAAPPGEAPLAWRIDPPDGPVARFTANRPGTYRLRLTVENRSGRRVSRSVRVELREGAPPGAPPPVPAADTDGDGAPDPLDLDSDGDGVADALDAAPRDGDVSAWRQWIEQESPLGGAANDRADAAEAVGAWNAPGVQILGAVAAAGDLDLYRIDLPAGRYALGLLAEGPLPALNLLTLDERPQPYRDLPVPEGRLLTFAIAAAGPRLLAVSGEAPAGYTLVLYADDDQDGLGDALEAALGADPARPDSDGDGLPDGWEARPVLAGEADVDADGDGRPPWLDRDSDGDGLPDRWEGAADTDGDGLPDAQDTDADGNGLPDGEEAGPLAWVQGPRDSDGDGTPDFRDRDDDGDGLPDPDEPAGGRLRPAPPWDPEPGLLGQPRVDGIGEEGGPDGACRPGRALYLRGARLPVDGEARVVVEGPDGPWVATPAQRSEDAWPLPCPDLPPGTYRLRPFHDGRAGPALELTVADADAPLLTALDLEPDSTCPAPFPYRIRPRGEGITYPYVLTFPKPDPEDPNNVFVIHLEAGDPWPCLPAEAVAAGPARLRTALGDSPPIHYRPPRLREPPPLVYVALAEAALLDSGLGASVEYEPPSGAASFVGLALARTEATLVLAWTDGGAHLRAAGFIVPGDDDPVFPGDGEATARTLARLALGPACTLDEDAWTAANATPAIDGFIRRLEADGGLPWPSATPDDLQGFLDALREHARCEEPSGELSAFVARSEGELVLAARNDTGLPAVLAYRDRDGHPLVTAQAGGVLWRPGPSAWVVRGVDGQSGYAVLATPASSAASAVLDPPLWRRAWVTAAARALWPAFALWQVEGDDALARRLPAVAESALDRALARAWDGAPRAALADLVADLAGAARDGDLDALLAGAPELPWARLRLAFLLELQGQALAAGVGPLAQLAEALEMAPARRVFDIRFPPELRAIVPGALRLGGGDQRLTLLGRGLRVVERDLLGYRERRPPTVVVSRGGQNWTLAADTLAVDQRSLTVRLPAFLTGEEGETVLRVRVRQPREDGGETVLSSLLDKIILLPAPQITAVGADRAVPGGELEIFGRAFPARPADLRLTLIDAADDEYPLAVATTAPERVTVTLPPDLPPGDYRLRLQVADGQGEWLDATFTSPEVAQLRVSRANVAFRLCDAGSIKDDTLALYLDGVYQGSFQASDGGEPYREFAFQLPPGSSHVLRVVLQDAGGDTNGTYGLEPVRNLAIFTGASLTGNLEPGGGVEWVFRVAERPTYNVPVNPPCSGS